MAESSCSSFDSMDSGELEKFNEHLWETFADTQQFLETQPLDDDLDVDAGAVVENVDELIIPLDLNMSSANVMDGATASMSTLSAIPSMATDDMQQAELDRMYKKKLREAAALRLKRKRDERRMNGKGARYEGRKKSAESRPRVNGRFVKRDVSNGK